MTSLSQLSIVLQNLYFLPFFLFPILKIARTDSVGDSSAPPGCAAERLSQFAPRTVLEHEELATSLRSDGEGGHIPHQLQAFLESVKRQYLEFTKTMKVTADTQINSRM